MGLAHPAASACLLRRRYVLPALSPTPASRILQTYLQSRIMNKTIEQTASETLDWTLDWSTRGLGTDTIASSSWSASSSDFTLGNPSHTTTAATIWLTGGIPGKIYSVTNTVATVGGRTMQETVPYVCLPARNIGNAYD